jgi:hypothetical protein
MVSLRRSEMFIAAEIQFHPAPFEGAERYYAVPAKLSSAPSNGAGDSYVFRAINISLLRSGDPGFTRQILQPELSHQSVI